MKPKLLTMLLALQFTTQSDAVTPWDLYEKSENNTVAQYTLLTKIKTLKDYAEVLWNKDIPQSAEKADTPALKLLWALFGQNNDAEAPIIHIEHAKILKDLGISLGETIVSVDQYATTPASKLSSILFSRSYDSLHTCRRIECADKVRKLKGLGISLDAQIPKSDQEVKSVDSRLLFNLFHGPDKYNDQQAVDADKVRRLKDLGIDSDAESPQSYQEADTPALKLLWLFFRDTHEYGHKHAVAADKVRKLKDFGISLDTKITQSYQEADTPASKLCSLYFPNPYPCKLDSSQNEEQQKTEYQVANLLKVASNSRIKIDLNTKLNKQGTLEEQFVHNLFNDVPNKGLVEQLAVRLENEEDASQKEIGGGPRKQICKAPGHSSSTHQSEWKKPPQVIEISDSEDQSVKEEENRNSLKRRNPNSDAR